MHYSEHIDDGFVLMRPHCLEFLKEMSGSCEIIIFTAGIYEYATWIIKSIDPNGELISHTLDRTHT